METKIKLTQQQEHYLRTIWAELENLDNGFYPCTKIHIKEILAKGYYEESDQIQLNSLKKFHLSKKE
jgi:hypothetical protein